MEFIREIIVECFGVFALVFVGGMSLATKAPGLIGAGFAHACILCMGIIIAGPISGGHLNPAVTIPLLMTGKCDKVKGLFYIAAQVGGSVLAALLLMAINPADNLIDLFPHHTNDNINAFHICFLEFLATFFLVIAVFMGIAAGLDERRIGLMVGGTLLAFIQAIGPFTGASLNPCRTLGPAIFTGVLFTELSQWAYYVGPIGGGICAGLFSALFIHKPKIEVIVDPSHSDFD